MVVCAAAAAIGARWAHPVPVIAIASAVLVAIVWPRTEVLVLAVALGASLLAGRSLAGMQPRGVGSWDGTVVLLTDPEWQFGQVRADMRVRGKHLLGTASGLAASRLASRSAGDRVALVGSVSAALRPVPGWMLARHVAGRITIREVHRSREGGPLFRLANAVRASLLRSAAALPAARRSLFAGFILGDSRDESPETNDDFRAAGLTHLLVVSGENVC